LIICVIFQNFAAFLDDAVQFFLEVYFNVWRILRNIRAIVGITLTLGLKFLG